MALHRDYLMPVEDREDELIDHAATLISPENGTMRRSRCEVKRLIVPLGTPPSLAYLLRFEIKGVALAA